MEIKEVPFEDFRKWGMNVFERHNSKVIRIRGKGMRYANMYYHDEKDDLFKRDGDILIDKEGHRIRECRVCGSLTRVKFVVPYDGSVAPGGYCYACRRKYSIMDIKDAKRYNKIL